MSGAAVSSGTAAKGHSICAAQAGFRLVMVGAPAGFEPALTAPEAASAIERICTICLHGFNRSPRMVKIIPRIFRIMGVLS